MLRIKTIEELKEEYGKRWNLVGAGWVNEMDEYSGQILTEDQITLYEEKNKIKIDRWTFDSFLITDKPLPRTTSNLKRNVIKLPVKIGDTLYKVHSDEILEGKVSMLQQLSDGRWKFRFSYQNNSYKSKSFYDVYMDKVGVQYFLTKEEAEKEQKELKERI